MEKQWYVVYTKPGAQKRAFETLKRKEIEAYLPLNRVVRDSNSNKKIIDEPLFANYIFVRDTALQVLELKKLPGIVNLVYWLGKPVTIDHMEIIMIKNFLNDHINVSIEKTILGSDTLRKFDSSIVEQEGLLLTVKNKKVNAILPSLGYILTAEVESSNVRIISPDNLIHRLKLMPTKIFNPVHSLNNFFKN